MTFTIPPLASFFLGLVIILILGIIIFFWNENRTWKNHPEWTSKTTYHQATEEPKPKKPSTLKWWILGIIAFLLFIFFCNATWTIIL